MCFFLQKFVFNNFLGECENPWVKQPLLGVLLWQCTAEDNQSTTGNCQVLSLHLASSWCHLSNHLHLHQDHQGVVRKMYGSQNHSYLIYRRPLPSRWWEYSMNKLRKNEGWDQTCCRLGKSRLFIEVAQIFNLRQTLNLVMLSTLVGLGQFFIHVALPIIQENVNSRARW